KGGIVRQGTLYPRGGKTWRQVKQISKIYWVSFMRFLYQVRYSLCSTLVDVLGVYT
ncbi:hypothetical protein MKX03_013668, partial [Papaver bracteatum]